MTQKELSEELNIPKSTIKDTIRRNNIKGIVIDNIGTIDYAENEVQMLKYILKDWKPSTEKRTIRSRSTFIKYFTEVYHIIPSKMNYE